MSSTADLFSTKLTGLIQIGIVNMDRSIRKSISVNGFRYMSQLADIKDEQVAKLMPALFENPGSNQMYLLKDDIRTLADLKNRIGVITSNTDQLEAVVNAFSVTDDLPIPVELRRLFLSNSKMAFFVGAGVSRLLKIPLWDELADRAIDYLKESNYINFSEADRLRNERSTAKQTMSIFHQIIKDKGELKRFYEGCLKSEGNKNGNPYELLVELEQTIARPVIKISTNIDLEWEKVLKAKAEQKKGDISLDGSPVYSELYYERTQSADFQKGQALISSILYQIHGRLNDLDNAIVTTSQYVDHYRNENGLKGFLEGVFRTHTVLFIGSSIQEFEILEHCLKHSPIEHYALVGKRVDDENLFRVRKTYFSELRVKAIPYYLDFQEHDRLLILLRYWIDEIKASKSRQYYQDVALIEEVLRGNGR